jgi:hypothetical protein
MARLVIRSARGPRIVMTIHHGMGKIRQLTVTHSTPVLLEIHPERGVAKGFREKQVNNGEGIRMDSVLTEE